MFINPLLAYETPEATQEFSESRVLESQITAFIDKATAEGDASDVSVYFRDLSRGRRVGVKEKQGYEPASLLKVVIMIAYYKEAEGDPALLGRLFPYNARVASSLSEIPFQTPSLLRMGDSYTVVQLIEAMIVNSDNGAKDILLEHVIEGISRLVYVDVDNSRGN